MILELLQNICNLLERSNIKYMISGSIALNIYTIPRMTRDIDIVIQIDEHNLDNFLTLFQNFYYNK